MEAQIFSLNSTKVLAQKICEHLQINLSPHEERDFEDGEHKVRPLENVRGRDIFVLQSLYSDQELSVNDKLCRLLFFVGALKDASARHVTAVIPYFAYARKDRKTKDRDPVTSKYMAQLLEAAGVDQIISLDVHNVVAYQNSFRIPTEHLESRILFAPHLAEIIQSQEVVVVSPDSGGVKRAELFRETLEEIYQKKIARAFVEKHRSQGVVTGGEFLVGDVSGKIAIIYDDIISSGATLALAAEALAQGGARSIYACISHGLFMKGSAEILTQSKIEKLFVTDSVSSLTGTPRINHPKVEALDSSVLFAKAIRRAQSGDSLMELVKTFPHSQLEQHWPS